MATAALIPVSEYLATTYRPDCDYIDGEVKERNVGRQIHAALQGFVNRYIANQGKQWNLRVYPELRMQVAPTRFRIPDVCAHPPAIFPGGVLRTAPFLCVEILSPDDSLGSMQDRIDDYIGMGVVTIWLIDPFLRRTWTADADGIHPLHADAFTVPGSPVRMPVAELWAELDGLAGA
jgi:Uma2 family endonuclease